MSRFTLLALLLVATLAVAVGCGKDDKGDSRAQSRMDAKASAGKSLWYRLGGEKGVSAVIDDFVANSAADPKVNFARLGTPRQWEATEASVKKLKRRLLEFISQHTGGPIKYQGQDMVKVHTGMNITEPEFDALAGHLSRSLDKFEVPPREKDELLAIIGGTKPQIVGK